VGAGAEDVVRGVRGEGAPGDRKGAEVVNAPALDAGRVARQGAVVDSQTGVQVKDPAALAAGRVSRQGAVVERHSILVQDRAAVGRGVAGQEASVQYEPKLTMAPPNPVEEL